MKRKVKVVVEVTVSDLRLMRESLLALRNRLIAEGHRTAPVDEMLERLFRNLLTESLYDILHRFTTPAPLTRAKAREGLSRNRIYLSLSQSGLRVRRQGPFR